MNFYNFEVLISYLEFEFFTPKMSKFDNFQLLLVLAQNHDFWRENSNYPLF